MKRETNFSLSHPRTRLFHLRASKLLNDGVISRESYEEFIQLYKDTFKLSHEEYNQQAGLV